jgi:hypothetical protein
VNLPVLPTQVINGKEVELKTEVREEVSNFLFNLPICQC